MKKLVLLTGVVALILAFTGTAVLARDNDDHGRDHRKGCFEGQCSDFALFDGTNPANLDTTSRTGVVCGVTNAKQNAIVPGKSFTYYIVVTNDGSGPLECKVIYTDLDFVRFKVPLGSSFSLSQAAGSGANDAAVRLDCDANISGSMSVQGPKGVFCVSCDENDAFCDKIINTVN